MNKIIVLGNKGMFGHMVEQYLNSTKKYNVIGLNRKDLDVFDWNYLDTRIKQERPDYVINCIGILNNHDDYDLYAKGNIILPKLLSSIGTHNNYKLIHISTNCVFEDKGPHTIYDKPNAKDMYGISKAFGEIIDNKNLTIRTSIIGPELKDGIGLMNQVIQGRVSKGYSNIYWNGVTTLELSKFIEQSLDNKVGLIHYTSNTVNKYELCKNINEVFETGHNLKSVVIENDIHESLLEGSKSKLSIIQQLEELKKWLK